MGGAAELDDTQPSDVTLPWLLRAHCDSDITGSEGARSSSIAST
jgi:hypothetical protein